MIKSANEEQLLTAAAQPQKIETDRSLNFVKKELEIDLAAVDEKREFQADGAGIVESKVQRILKGRGLTMSNSGKSFQHLNFCFP